MSDKKEYTQAEIENMGDEDFANLDPASFVVVEKKGKDESDNVSSDESKSADSQQNAEDDAGSAGGSDTGDNQQDDGDSADSTSDESDDSSDNDQATDDSGSDRSDPHQGDDNASDDSSDSKDDSGGIDYKSEYKSMMSPLRAANKTINLKSSADLRRLAQMGVDYSRKMEDLKPQRRIVETLKRNDLLDEKQINFLIDLHKGDEAAIKEFLKDKDIDQFDLSEEDNTAYKPTDHIVDDSDVQLTNVLDTIRDTKTFDNTIKTVKNMDNASKTILHQHPEFIKYLNDHMEAGVFEPIMDYVAQERLLGRFQGLSDLEAYRDAGLEMQKQGKIGKPPADDAQYTGKTADTNSEQKLRDQKRKAGPTKGSVKPPQGKKKVPDYSQLDDEAFEQVAPPV